jgi:hypothetical protein
VSKHRKVLQNAGLVERSPAGTRNLYALAPDGLGEIERWLVGLWTRG